MKDKPKPDETNCYHSRAVADADVDLGGRFKEIIKTTVVANARDKLELAMRLAALMTAKGQHDIWLDQFTIVETGMSEERRMTKAEVLAIVKDIWGPIPKPKPKIVVNEAKVIRDAIVRVSPDDPNYRSSDDGVVRVRAPNWVTIRMDLYEEQQEQRREERRRRREIDPCRLGHWGPVDEDE